MASFPAPDVRAALANPTVSTTANGYTFVTTSPAWKAACAPLPSFAAVQWPGYATTCVPAVIDGREVVIQPWMGRCEQFFGRSNFPGGMGGEVAVYVKVPGGQPLPDLSLLPAPLRRVFEAWAALGGDDLWWPDPDVQPEIDFTIFDPVTRAVLVHAEPETNYWVNKWMEPASYEKLDAAHGHTLPSWPTHFKMVFTVAGVTRAWQPGAPLVPKALGAVG